MRKKLAALINFSSNEYPFLKPCVEAAAKIADQVIISVCDHFFDGIAENKALLQTAYLENPECTFIEYPFESSNVYAGHPPAFWHCWGRLLGLAHADPSVEYVLFLDVDEIIDVEAFAAWFAEEQNFTSQWLYSFWYFKEPIYRSQRWEENAVLARKEVLRSPHIMHHLERAGTYFNIEGSKKREVVGLRGLPMVHHYSWVRTKGQMLRKVASWGHRNDYPWHHLVEEEFSRPFTGKDFIYGMPCDTVSSTLELKDPTFLFGTPQNVHCITTQEMHQLEHKLW